MPEYLPEPRNYELMTILSPDVPEDDIASETERVGSYITSASGELQETLTDSPWGRRRLAYPIRHAGRDVRDGFYTVYHFGIEPSHVRDVERELKLNTSVMRYLVTRHEPVPPEELSEEDAQIAAEDEAAAAYAAAQAAGETATIGGAADTTLETKATEGAEDPAAERGTMETVEAVAEPTGVEEGSEPDSSAEAVESTRDAAPEPETLASGSDSSDEQPPTETEER